MNKTSMFRLPNRTRYGTSLYHTKAISNGRTTRKHMVAPRACYWVMRFGRNK